MNIFRSDDRYIYLNAQYCEFYVPMSYFDSKWMVQLSDTIKGLGLFNIGIFENGELKEIRLLNLPTSVEFFVYDTERRTMNFNGEDNVQCLVLKYIKDQKIMESSTIEDSSSSEMYLDIILKGKVPPSIPYTKVLNV